MKHMKLSAKRFFLMFFFLFPSLHTQKHNNRKNTRVCNTKKQNKTKKNVKQQVPYYKWIVFYSIACVVSFILTLVSLIFSMLSANETQIEIAILASTFFRDMGLCAYLVCFVACFVFFLF